MVCVAQDICQGKPVEDPVLIKKLLPSLLPLVLGMPIILTQNIAIELGLINGLNGIFRQLVYQVDCVSTNSLSEALPSSTQYIRRPSYAIIEITRSKN